MTTDQNNMVINDLESQGYRTKIKNEIYEIGKNNAVKQYFQVLFFKSFLFSSNNSDNFSFFRTSCEEE